MFSQDSTFHSSGTPGTLLLTRERRVDNLTFRTEEGDFALCSFIVDVEGVASVADEIMKRTSKRRSQVSLKGQKLSDKILRSRLRNIDIRDKEIKLNAKIKNRNISCKSIRPRKITKKIKSKTRGSSLYHFYFY